MARHNRRLALLALVACGLLAAGLTVSVIAVATLRQDAPERMTFKERILKSRRSENVIILKPGDTVPGSTPCMNSNMLPLYEMATIHIEGDTLHVRRRDSGSLIATFHREGDSARFCPAPPKEGQGDAGDQPE